MSDKVRSWLAIAVIGASLAVVIAALSASEPSDADRVHALADSLKCPVCTSESIADSPAQIARDLRDLIEEQVAAGMSDQDIRDFFVATYGEQVLLDPPSGGRSVVLWALPIAVAAVGIMVILGLRSRVGRELSDEERDRVRRAVEEHE